MIDLVCKKKGRPNLWKSFRSINQLSNGGTLQTFSHFIIAYDWLTAQIEKLPKGKSVNESDEMKINEISLNTIHICKIYNMPLKNIKCFQIYHIQMQGKE